MALEDDLHIRTYDSPEHRTRVALLYTYQYLTDRIRDFLEPHGLTQQQFNTLRILRGSHPTPISTKDLMERMINKQSDASRMVDRLVARGWVEKRPCPQDRRKLWVTITPEGLQLLDKLDRVRAEHDGILSHLSSQEHTELVRLLAKVRQELE
jgi:DNA-binding MarR family transcriptional regulator